MKILSAFLLLSATHASALPAPGLTPAPKPALHASDRGVEERLREWLSGQTFAPKPAVSPEMADLKDAVASPAAGLRGDIAKAEGRERQKLADRLPGMSADPFNSCRALETCRARTSFHVESEGLVSDAVAGLVRPWIIVEKARSSALSFEPAKDAGDKILDLTVPTAPAAGLAVRVAPVASGGFDVWLTGKADPAELFKKERAAALPSQD